MRRERRRRIRQRIKRLFIVLLLLFVILMILFIGKKVVAAIHIGTETGSEASREEAIAQIQSMEAVDSRYAQIVES